MGFGGSDTQPRVVKVSLDTVERCEEGRQQEGSTGGNEKDGEIGFLPTEIDNNPSAVPIFLSWVLAHNP